MKTRLAILSVLISISAIAQQPMKKYLPEWKKIDSLIQKTDQTRNALTVVNGIMSAAVKEKNEVQVIKSLIYQASLESEITENAQPVAIRKLEKYRLTEPAESVLNSIIAEQYWRYFQQNRWRFYNRTAGATGFKQDDLETWTAEDFHSIISKYFLSSLKNEKQLKDAKLAGYDAIIEKGNMRKLRPTLFDLLSHRALGYFMNDERMVTSSAVNFEIDDAAAYAPAPEFAKHSFKTTDSASLYFRALVIYQQLLKFHYGDTDASAYADADIHRLQFVHQHSVITNKELLYEEALRSITTRYGNLPAASQAWYLLANIHADKAREYQPGTNDANRYEWLKAKEICEKIIAVKEASEGKANAQNLLSEILKKDFSIQTEKVNIPGKPFLAHISFSNIGKLYFRIVPIEKRTKDSLLNRQDDEYWKKLASLKPLKQFEQALPDTKDYQRHSAEMKIDALSAGQYALIASTTPSFALDKNPMAVQFVYISRISWINKSSDHFLLDRETGAPISGATVQAWYNSYDYTNRRNAETKGPQATSDKNGFFAVESPKVDNSVNYKLDIKAGSDRLFMDDQLYINSRNTNPANETVNTSFIFLDRAIYRPGQTVFFKGIMVSRNTKTGISSIQSGASSTIELYGANSEKITSLEVKSNEYGSYSGKFVLPSGSMNGSFRIYDVKNRGNNYFRVEEYKRPRFEVSIAAPAKSYQVNDSVKVSGTATAFAGNTMNGAKVKYRVVRTAIFPMYWDGGYRGRMIWPPYPRNEVQVAHGETITDAAGNFDISFKAIPDLKTERKYLPVFNYQITADITDITGETRSAASTVSVGYHSLTLSISLAEKIHPGDLGELRITTQNLNGVFQKASVKLSMEKLQTPNRVFRSRLWEEPDLHLLDSAEFTNLFPHDVYSDEDKPQSWTTENQVFSLTDTTSESGSFKLPSLKPAAGWYKIEAQARDKNGDTIRDIHYLEIYESETVSPNAFAGIVVDPSSLKQDTRPRYRFVTNLDSVFLIREIGNELENPSRSFLSFNRTSPYYDLPTDAIDKDGTPLRFAFVKHNRLFTENRNIVIPDSSKTLDISYETFRDKTLPGSSEKWKLKISGYKRDKIASEVLTGMYDVSLDQFAPHSFSIPYLQGKQVYSQGWMGSSFQSASAIIKPEERSWENFIKTYDELIASSMLQQSNIRVRGYASGGNVELRGVLSGRVPGVSINQGEMYSEGAKLEKNMQLKDQVAAEPVAPPAMDTAAGQGNPTPTIRTNLNETAFFFPDLKTDSAGNIEFSFTMPEALTRWKWMTLAHTKDLAFGYSEKTIVTQKDLMVQPNATRFVRQGDRFDFSGKIANLTDKELTGQVELQLIDPTTNTPVDGWFKNVFPNQFFTAPAKQSVAVSFSMEVPFIYNKPLTYRLIARAGNMSDGEEGTLPVLSNRILVTEAIQLPVRGTGVKKFSFDKLLKSEESETLSSHSLTVEYTSNPAWYAVQALPWLADFPRESADQAFNRFYVHSLASKIANASPKLKEIFKKWNTTDTATILSNLEKNQELKSVLLSETPWVMEAASETTRRRQLAALFDLARMQEQQSSSLAKLRDLQSPNGGFVWFPGGPDDRYITQYILTGLGHLVLLDPSSGSDKKLQELITAALKYLDQSIASDYDQMVKSTKKGTAIEGGLGNLQIQYLYLRSAFRNYPVPGASMKAFSYYREQSQKTWIKQSRYMQAMIALALQRTDDIKTAKAIVTASKQNAVINEEMGMYWKDVRSGYFWHQAPVETQAVLIEAFAEINKDQQAVNDMKTWLLKQKQTQSWNTTRATAEACYALFLAVPSANTSSKPVDGIADLLQNNPDVAIRLGSTIVSTQSSGADERQTGSKAAASKSTDSTSASAAAATTAASASSSDPATGYFKKTFNQDQVKASMGNIEVTLKPSSAAGNNAAVKNLPSWGAVYWQYFENIDQVTAAAGALQVKKQLFVETQTDRGAVLRPITSESPLKVGDKLKVRIEIRSDRDLEYVHMKDMRAAGTEPVNVLSSYKWQDGLGYYESTGDAATNFYFSWLRKGVYVFEYPLFVTHTGHFSNGLASIQSLYAPEFTSHSEGINITVE